MADLKISSLGNPITTLSSTESTGPITDKKQLPVNSSITRIIANLLTQCEHLSKQLSDIKKQDIERLKNLVEHYQGDSQTASNRKAFTWSTAAIAGLNASLCSILAGNEVTKKAAEYLAKNFTEQIAQAFNSHFDGNLQKLNTAIQQMQRDLDSQKQEINSLESAIEKIQRIFQSVIESQKI